MTSLADVYEREVGETVGRRRLWLGFGLFATGAVLTAAGLVVASTDVLSTLGLDRTAAWRRAGVLGGLGVAGVLAGVFTVLPSDRRVKAAATIGASLSVLGVALFWHAYPAHWAGYGRQLTLPVAGVYFLGTTIGVWSLFVGIANFKRRNDPGGTVSLRVTREGETEVVEVSRDRLREEGLAAVDPSSGSGADGPAAGTGKVSAAAVGGDSGTGTGAGGGATSAVGGAEPAPTTDLAPDELASEPAPDLDPDLVEATPTADRTDDDGANGRAADLQEVEAPAEAEAEAAAGAASDGGLEDDGLTSLKTEGEVVGTAEAARDLADRYCGNCEHFRYVRSEDGMQPYCGLHGEAMDDMEACEDWSSNH